METKICNCAFLPWHTLTLTDMDHGMLTGNYFSTDIEHGMLLFWLHVEQILVSALCVLRVKWIQTVVLLLYMTQTKIFLFIKGKMHSNIYCKILILYDSVCFHMIIYDSVWFYIILWYNHTLLSRLVSLSNLRLTQ